MSNKRIDHTIKFYECNCYTEGIGYSVIDDESWHELNLFMWSRGKYYHGEPLSFRERLRWCWNVIKTGVPYTDECCLTSDVAREFANDILKECDIMDKKIAEEEAKE